MFDKNDSADLKNQQGDNKAGGPPTDLPVEPPVLKAKEPEDIFGDVDSTPTAQNVERPSQPAAMTDDKSSSPVMSTPAANPPKPSKPKMKMNSGLIKKVLIIVVSIAAAIGLIYAGFAAYSYFITKSTQDSPTENTEQMEVSQNTNTNQPSVQNNTPPEPVIIDTDKDGISDEEEALYGTNINEADTDKDGLTDRDEIKVFKTDPINADSDGDGFTDGEEVRNGFDPKGDGKLLKL